MMSLEGKVAVITGAGTGIGQGIALAMAKAGASIVVDYVGKAEVAQGTIDQITGMGGKAIGVDADISNPDDVATLIQKTIAAYSKLDIFVNNAASRRSLRSSTTRSMNGRRSWRST